MYLIVFNVMLLCHLIKHTSAGEKSFTACKEYGETMLECHNILQNKPRVRVPIDLLLYPHMVLIGFKKTEQQQAVWKCGGSLISEKWILTAAHCMEDPLCGLAEVLRIGTATFEFDEVDGLDQERRVTERIPYPEYKPPSKYHDIALLRTEVPFTLSRDIRIACLPQTEVIQRVNLTAIGFGKTKSLAEKGSDTLMKVEVDIIDRSICNKSMKFLIKRKVLAQGIIENQLCAGDYENGGKDTCQGDSGGPLQVMEERVDCVHNFPLHTVIGVTSFGRDCGRKMAPGVYTKVYPYVSWIESVVWP